MREIRQSGSEGGASQFNETSLPLSNSQRLKVCRKPWLLIKTNHKSPEGAPIQ